METIDILRQAHRNASGIPVKYRVQPRDTLSRIIHDYYGIAYGDPRYPYAQAALMFHNPAVTNPDMIRAGQYLTLVPLALSTDMCQGNIESIGEQMQTALEPIYGDRLNNLDTYLPPTQEEKEIFWALAWLHEHYGILNSSAGLGFGTLGGLVSQGNNALIAEVKSLYLQYSRGYMTKGQYDYRRAKALKNYADQLGPFEKLLFNGQTTPEAIRISRLKAVPATIRIDQQLSKLGRLSKLASHGGIVLTAASVGMGCYDIAHTDSRQEKNEIFVETLGSVLGGAFTSMIITALLISTPIGWTTAIVLAGASVVASWGGGKGAVALYNKYGEEVDIVSTTGVDQLCRS